MKTPLVERLDKRIRRSKKSGCWIWTAMLNADGYAIFEYQDKTFSVHRWQYLQIHGEIPDGKELDHLCRVRHCVNPDHLEPVTHAENVARGQAGINMKLKTHCPAGHSYDDLNTYIYPKTGSRGCKKCRNAKAVAFTKEKRAKVEQLVSC